MFFQYSSPAAADLFKFYYTLAQMKFNLLYTDLREKEQKIGGDSGLLQDASQIRCIDEKMGNGGDLAEAMDFCRKHNLYQDLDPSNDYPIEAYKKIFNIIGGRAELRDAILSILPKWIIDRENYNVQGPAKRIGMVLTEKRAQAVENLDNALSNYREPNPDDLKGLSLPGHPFTQKDLLNLLMVDAAERQKITYELKERVATAKTLDLYEEAMEWLRRAADYPAFHEAYKNIIRAGMDFVQREKLSLTDKQQQIKEYSDEMRSMQDVSEKLRIKMIGDSHYGQ